MSNSKLNEYYLKYKIYNDKKYLKKIYNSINLKNNKIGGTGDINMVVNNIDLIISNVNNFKQIYEKTIENDNIIRSLDKSYIGYNNNDNLDEYIKLNSSEIENFLK
jgi:hypothetical protein